MSIKTGMVLSGVTRMTASDAVNGLTPSQAAILDAVITNSHEHQNKPDLDKISSQDNQIKFNDNFVHIPLTSPGW